MYKTYHNALYETVADGDWLAGYCCIFANALRERFGIQMRALMIKSLVDGDETLVHAFAVLGDGRMVDARGVRSESAVMADYSEKTENDWRDISCYHNGEIELLVRDITLDELWDLNPEDHEATNAAHAFIDAHTELFGELQAIGQPCTQRETTASFGM